MFTTKYCRIAGLILIAIALLRLPVQFGMLRAQFQLLAESGVTLLLAAYIFRINKWLGLFLALTVISSIYPIFGRWSYTARNAIVYGLLWFVLIWHVKDSVHILNALCVIVLVNVLFATMQLKGLDPYKIFTFGFMTSETAYPVGLMANKNILSTVIAFGLPAFLRPKWILFSWIPLIGLFVASSVGGTLATLGGLLFYGFMKLKTTAHKVLALLASFNFLMYYLIFCDLPTVGERLDGWYQGWLLFKQNWIFGCGIGHAKLIMKGLSAKPTFIQMHNEFLQAVMEMGIIVIPVFIGYFYFIYKGRRNLIPATALIIIILNSCVNFPFHIGTTAIIAVTWMALFQKEAVCLKV